MDKTDILYGRVCFEQMLAGNHPPVCMGETCIRYESCSAKLFSAMLLITYLKKTDHETLVKLAGERWLTGAID